MASVADRRARTRQVSAARAAYIRGDGSIDEMARRYDVPVSTMRKIAKTEQWERARNDARAAGVRKAAELAAEQIAARAARLLSAADRALEAAERGMDAGRGYTGTSKELRDLTQSLRDLREIVGLIPAGDLAEQQARIDKLRAETSRTERGDDAQTVTVVFAPGTEDYAG